MKDLINLIESTPHGEYGMFDDISLGGAFRRHNKTYDTSSYNVKKRIAEFKATKEDDEKRIRFHFLYFYYLEHQLEMVKTFKETLKLLRI